MRFSGGRVPDRSKMSLTGLDIWQGDYQVPLGKGDAPTKVVYAFESFFDRSGQWAGVTLMALLLEDKSQLWIERTEQGTLLNFADPRPIQGCVLEPNTST